LNREKMTDMTSFFDEFRGDSLNRLKWHVESRK